MAWSWKASFQQPTLYFVALGVVAFAVDKLRNDDAVITVTADVRAEVERRLLTDLGHAPNETELSNGIERWRETEALYREALHLGLLENDSTFRAHLAGKLRSIEAERAILPEPDEPALRAYFDAHSDSFRTPAEFDAEHVFLSAAKSGNGPDRELLLQTRTAEVLQALAAGAPFETAGDSFPRGPRFTKRTAGDLQQELSADLSPALQSPVVGVWYTLNGKRGVHLLRFTNIDDGRPNFERLRGAVRLAYLAAEKQRLAQQFVDELQSKYRYREEP